MRAPVYSLPWLALPLPAVYGGAADIPEVPGSRFAHMPLTPGMGVDCSGPSAWNQQRAAMQRKPDLVPLSLNS